MNRQDVPLFSNNCGKIYRNKVVFAAHKEPIEPQNIKLVSLQKSLSKGSLFFVLVPAIFFIIPFFVHDFFEKILFAIIGCSLMVLAFIMAKRNTYINVSLKNGKRYRFKIWYGYVREAKKFVDEAKKLVARKSLPNAVEEEIHDHDTVMQNHGIPVVK